MVDRFDMVKFDSVVDCVCRVMSLDKKDLDTRKRDRILVDARRIIANIIMNEEICSISGLARSMGKNHATLIHYRKTHNNVYETDIRYTRTYEMCLKAYKGETHRTFEDILQISDEFQSKVDEIERLKSENAELKYTILKLENKVRQKHYAIA